MKKLYLLLFLLTGYTLAFAQQEAEVFKMTQIIRKDLAPTELKAQYYDVDLSKIWLTTSNEYVFGFIGDDFQRIRVKFITVTKNRDLPGAYEISGKSMVKGNVDEFKGELQVSNIRKLNPSPAMAKYYTSKGIKGEYVILGDYVFKENEKEKHSGVFKGAFQTTFFVDKNNKPQYDDLNKVSDSFTNNQFIGQWLQYNSQDAKRCNWGDYRIPNARGTFDTGEGEFSPAGKYLKAGWQTYHDAMKNDKKAKAIETAKWW